MTLEEDEALTAVPSTASIDAADIVRYRLDLEEKRRNGIASGAGMEIGGGTCLDARDVCFVIGMDPVFGGIGFDSGSAAVKTIVGGLTDRGLFKLSACAC